jgi:hypothetical protein
VRIAAGIAVLGLLAILVWLAFDFVFDRAPPHRFVVNADREIRSAQLKLNGKARTMVVYGKSASAGMMLSDASGAIMIVFADGTTTECRIGYITNGEMEPHEIVVEGGKCTVPSIAV